MPDALQCRLGWRAAAALALLLWVGVSESAGGENLEQAWAAALAADRRLSAAGRSTVAAEHRVAAARAERLPTISLDGGYRALSDEQALIINVPNVANDVFPIHQREGFHAGADVRLPLYTSGRIFGAIDASEAELAGSRFRASSTLLDLKLEVATAYLAVLRATRLLEAARRNVESLAAHTEDVERMFEVGTAARSDLLAARVALLDARQRAIRDGNTLDTARAAYNRLLGRPLTQPVDLDELPVERVTGTAEAFTARAVVQRPELAEQRARVRALREQAASVRAGARPSVGIHGNYRFQENRFQTPEGVAAIGLGVEWRPFDGGATWRRAAAIEQEALALADHLEDAASRIELEVFEAWLAVRETRQRLEVTTVAIHQAEESLKVMRDRYREGVGANTDVLEAESLRTQSHANHAHAVYDAIESTVGLKRAVGDL